MRLCEEKTLVTHARSERARFLGYEVEVLHADTKRDQCGQRIINGVMGLRVSRGKMQAKMSKYVARGKPVHRAELMHYSDCDIVSQY
ncbi:MAG: hypothetical protein LBC12_05295 [Nitrososphaerota archaeon]|nr:hypothetical protein [Nitrososphaerota archaeon]